MTKKDIKKLSNRELLLVLKALRPRGSLAAMRRYRQVILGPAKNLLKFLASQEGR